MYLNEIEAHHVRQNKGVKHLSKNVLEYIPGVILVRSSKALGTSIHVHSKSQTFGNDHSCPWQGQHQMTMSFGVIVAITLHTTIPMATGTQC